MRIIKVRIYKKSHQKKLPLDLSKLEDTRFAAMRLLLLIALMFASAAAFAPTRAFPRTFLLEIIPDIRTRLP